MESETAMTYEQAQNYLEQAKSLGSILGLDNMRNLMKEMGDPQDHLRFIHVAGTNGKGSVSCFIATILKQSGMKVGRYSSPCVFSEMEKIRIGEKMISKAVFAACIAKVKEAVDALLRKGKAHPTIFEMETAAAFSYFAQNHCDVVVMECGLGGQEDATNIIKTTDMAVITSISMDHMAYLGNTLEEIAAQKAGIIKEGISVICEKQEEEVVRAIREKCQKEHAELIMMDPALIKGIHYGLSGQYFSYEKAKKLEITMVGHYQIENAALAYVAAMQLQKIGYPVTERSIRKGLASASWKGRFEIIKKRPYFIIDGAHNENAARKLADTVSFYFTNKKIVFIMGVLKDKEYEKIARIMAPLAFQILTITPPDNPRALPGLELAQVVSRYNPRVTTVDSLEEAVELSMLLADKETVILAFGSLSYLGALKKLVLDSDKIKKDTHGKGK